MSFIIAEIGVNWDGDLNLVEDMIRHAKKSGCNAVKFQAFDEKIVEKHPQKNRLMKSSIAKENVESIDKIAKSVGIEWFCTPMYVDAVDFLEPFVKRYKIREFDGRQLIENNASDLFKKISSTGKEIIISTQKSPTQSIFFTNPMIKWLYCVPKYPCELSDLDFSHIKDFYGFSNHCSEIIAPITAAILGSKIIEIHMTSDKSADFIDNNVSFDYYEIDEIVLAIRKSERIKK